MLVFRINIQMKAMIWKVYADTNLDKSEEESEVAVVSLSLQCLYCNKRIFVMVIQY
tara:strand:+ start:245 stop:412 length:168 start_codon:yes stop_codon:yes gene_type:complete